MSELTDLFGIVVDDLAGEQMFELPLWLAEAFSHDQDGFPKKKLSVWCGSLTDVHRAIDGIAREFGGNWEVNVWSPAPRSDVVWSGTVDGAAP